MWVSRLGVPKNCVSRVNSRVPNADKVGVECKMRQTDPRFGSRLAVFPRADRWCRRIAGKQDVPPPVPADENHSGELGDVSETSEPVESRCLRRLSSCGDLGRAVSLGAAISPCRSEGEAGYGRLWFGIGGGSWLRSFGIARECREVARDFDNVDDAEG